MQIFVKADRTHIIEVESSDTIDQLMHVIYDKTRYHSYPALLEIPVV